MHQLTAGIMFSADAKPGQCVRCVLFLRSKRQIRLSPYEYRGKGAFWQQWTYDHFNSQEVNKKIIITQVNWVAKLNRPQIRQLPNYTSPNDTWPPDLTKIKIIGCWLQFPAFIEQKCYSLTIVVLKFCAKCNLVLTANFKQQKAEIS